MQSPAEELFEAVQERNGLLSRAVNVISTLQVGAVVAVVHYKADQEGRCFEPKYLVCNLAG